MSRTTRLLALLFAVTAAAALVVIPATAADAAPSAWAGVISVKLDIDSPLPDIPGIRSSTPTFPGADGDTEQADLARWVTVNVATGAEDRVLAALDAAPGVTLAERVPLATPAYDPDDPRAGEQWHLDTIGARRAWDHARGSQLRLGIIDTQFDVGHPDLAPRLEDRSGNVGRTSHYTGGCSWATPFADHGTLVAGVAAALADNGRGVAGVAFDTRVVAVQAGREVGGTCLVAGEWVQALRDLAADGVPVVNLSFATPERSQLVSDAVRYATNQGTLVIAAAGNSASSAPHYPAAEPGVIAVGATIEADQLWSRTNRGPWVDVAAPGDRILTTCPGGGYCLTAGTSIAAPMVASSALLVASETGARGTRLGARVLDASTRVDGQVLHAAIGRGRVAADRAVTEDVVRLFGAGRVETAVAISRQSNPVASGTASVVDRIVVVPGNAPQEAGWTVTLPAAGLLNDERTAVVVTDRAALSTSAAEEISRLAGGSSEVEIVLPGDTGTGVGRDVEQALAAYRVRRVAGGDVAGTAAALADLIVADRPADRVLVARGDTFADALSLAGPAGAFGYPLLFVNPTSVPAATCDWLRTNPVSTIHVAGGTAAISDRVARDLRSCGTTTDSSLFEETSTSPTVVRDAGASRVETAVAIARRHFGNRPFHVSVANGWKWPDAVTGGALAVAHGAPILVLPSDATALPSSVADYVRDVKPSTAFVLGGPVVVGDAVEADLEKRV